MKELNIDGILNNKKWVVTWKGNPIDRKILEIEKPGTARTSALALEFLLNRDGAKCRKCGRADYLTVEHIIPQSFLYQIGMTREQTYGDWENLEILCKLCNAFKGASLDFANPKTKTLLLKYVASIPDLPA